MSKAIPKDWTLATLSDMAEIDPESLKSTTSDDFEFKYIDIASVSTGRIDLPSESIRFVDAPSRARRKVRAGDVLMSTVRPNLKAFAYFDKSINECIASTGFAVIRAKNGNVGRFIFNSIMSDGVSRQIDGLVVGSNYPAINSSDVRALEVLKPPIGEQQKIASILTAVDEVIASTIAQINKLKDLKAGMMQELLTKGIGRGGQPHTEFKDSPVGRIPKAWEVKLFKDVFSDYKYGPRFSSKDYDLNGNVKTIRGTDVSTSGDIKYSQVPIAKIDPDTVNMHALKDGDLLMITTADCGLTAVFREQNVPFIASAYAIKLSPTDGINPEYVAYFMQTDRAKSQVESFIRKGTVANLPGSDVMSIAFACPPLNEQEKISSILEELDHQIQLKLSIVESKTRMKNALMQDLLTGAVRVNTDR